MAFSRQGSSSRCFSGVCRFSGLSGDAAHSAKLSEIDLGCVDLIDLFRVGSKDQSLH